LSTQTIGDQIDGGAGVDTLNIYVYDRVPRANSVMPPFVTFRSVEIVRLWNVKGSFGAPNLDASDFTGAKEIWQVGDADTLVNLPQGVTAGFKDGSVGYVVPEATAESVKIALDNFADRGRLDILAGYQTGGGVLSSVKIDGSFFDYDGDGTIGSMSLHVQVGADIQTLSIESGVAIRLYTLDGIRGKKLTTIDASASKGAITNANSPTTIATIKTGSGDDNITLATATSNTAGAVIDAYVSTGDGKDTVTVNVTGDGKTTISTGAGDDTVTIFGRDASALTIDLGDGADAFTSAVVINATDVIDAGAGKDTLTLSLVGAANVAAFRNFDAFDVKGMSSNFDLDILSAANSVTEVVGSGALGGNVTLQNVGAGVSFQATGDMGLANILTLTQKNAGALTVTLEADQVAPDAAGDDSARMAVSAANASSVSVVFDTAYLNAAGSQGGETAATDNLSTINLTAGAATTVSVVSGGANAQNVLTITDNAASDALTTVTVTGAQALTLSVVSASKLATIDAAATTGGLTASLADLANNGVIKLGSGPDVITATNASSPSGPESLQGFAKASALAVSSAPADASAKAAAIAAADRVVISGAQVAINQDGPTATLSDGVLTFKGAGPATLADAITLADAYAGNLNDTLAFQYVGDTYVFSQGDVGASVNDVLVKLVGVTGVTHLAENGATDQFFVV
jgi:hypothetical protein